MMDMREEPKRTHLGWARAAVIAGLVTGASVLGLVVVPDVLARMSSTVPLLVRDSAVLGWTVVFFIAASWTLIRAQGGREIIEPTGVPDGDEVTV